MDTFIKMFPSEEEDFYTDARAHKEGMHQAKVMFIKEIYYKIYQHNPDMIDGIQKSWLESEGLKLSENCYAYAVTVNPGNYHDIEKFITEFIYPFQEGLQRKRSLKDFYFNTERAPTTSRLHLHGYIKPDYEAKKCRTFPSQIQALVWHSVGNKWKKVNPKFNLKHIHVKPIYNVEQWQKYCTKNFPHHTSQNDFDPHEIFIFAK